MRGAPTRPLPHELRGFALSSRGPLLNLGARRLPASGSEQLVLRDGGDLEPRHRLPETRGYLRQHLGLVEIGGGRHDGFGTLQGVLGLEDARADEQAVHAELHHQRRVCRRGDATRREVDDGQAAETLAFDEQLDRRADLLGFTHELGVAQTVQLANPGVHGPGMSHRLDHVPGLRLTLGANHRRTFGDSSQRLAEVATATDEWNLERMLVDVVLLVGGCQHLGLVDVVDTKGFQDLRLDEVADAALRHDGDRHRLHDRADEGRIGHTRHAALLADVGRDALEGHHGARARILGDSRVFGRDHVHYHAALQHLGEPRLDLEGALYAPIDGPVSIARFAAFGHDQILRRGPAPTPTPRIQRWAPGHYPDSHWHWWRPCWRPPAPRRPRTSTLCWPTRRVRIGSTSPQPRRTSSATSPPTTTAPTWGRAARVSNLT